MLDIYYIAMCATLFVTAVMYCSFLEWTLHRYVMHRVFLGFKYPFKAHAQTHHGLFPHGRDYTIPADSTNPKHDKIKMAWWNSLVLVPIGTLPFVALALILSSWTVSVIPFLTIYCYYIAYETMHYYMHINKDVWVKRTRFFKFLDSHHHEHHRKHDKNLNVVLPLADLVLRTLSLRR